MYKINKQLYIKFKLSISVFETLNSAAFATQVRSLGATRNVVHNLLSHVTFCDNILPIIIGNNKNNSDWEREKLDYISSIQISVPARGYLLNLNAKFDKTNPMYSSNIEEYISEHELYTIQPAIEAKAEVKEVKENNKVIVPYQAAVDGREETKVAVSDSEVVKHILYNVAPIDLHRYFKYDEPRDYLYWVMATLSNEVANTVEDVNKSPNIRFFIYDETIARKSEMDLAGMQVKAITKLQALKNTPDGEATISNIALNKHVVNYDELEDMTSEDVYLSVFRYANTNPVEFLEVAEDKDLGTTMLIKRYVEFNIFQVEASGNIVETSNPSNVIGKDMTSAISYFKNPINKGEITKYETKYKSLKK